MLVGPVINTATIKLNLIVVIRNLGQWNFVLLDHRRSILSPSSKLSTVKRL